MLGGGEMKLEVGQRKMTQRPRSLEPDVPAAQLTSKETLKNRL